MQIQGLHKNIYKLYAYARTQECLEVYRQKYQQQVVLVGQIANQNNLTENRNSGWSQKARSFGPQNHSTIIIFLKRKNLMIQIKSLAIS